jgi:uncharacterized membrane protein
MQPSDNTPTQTVINQTTIVGIDIPFGTMVVLIIKLFFASIPAYILIFILMSIFTMLFGGIFGGMFMGLPQF